MIRNRILAHLEAALEKAAPSLNGLAISEDIRAGLKLERPRNPEHGDYAVNVSFLARETKMPPPKIADAIAPHLAGEGLFDVQVMGGYLNFKLSEAMLRESLVAIVRAEKPGLNDSLKHERMLLEYVSANPTGPLHIGHGRWAALGDSIVRILRHCGAFVTPEFYINDAGVQMQNIAISVFLRCRDILISEDLLSQKVAKDIEIELPYPGEYVIDLALEYLRNEENKKQILEDWQELHQEISGWPAPVALSLNQHLVKHGFLQPVATFARDLMLKMQQALLNEMHVHFDKWISEKQHLYERKDADGLNPIEKTLKRLVGKTIDIEGETLPLVYRHEDATWFRSSAYGDEKDRVLVKSDGSFTYLTPDIAYHDDKFNRPENYTKITNIWGADHHGYIPRMRGAITALGHDPEKFEVLLGQLVNLLVDGERTRMGKRRKMLTLQDVVEEVGVDATRFWMVSKSADSALDFDVDLAASASSENPVFYVQYAHARCCSILRNAVEAAPNVDTGEMAPPYVDAGELSAFEHGLTPDDLKLVFDSLTEEREKAVLRTLLLHLDSFEHIVKDAARLRAPHFLTQYMMEVAANFHFFYGVCRILTPEPALTRARLMLIRAIQKTLAQALDLIGVSAPEKM